jgi:RimJ/RimL family protein N-acetyltransferase
MDRAKLHKSHVFLYNDFVMIRPHLSIQHTRHEMSASMTPLFETQRLFVRHFTPDDLDDFAALCANPDVMISMGDGQTLPRETVAHWIDVCQTKYATRGYGTSAVFEKESGQFVGYCGVVRAPGLDFDEVIYAFIPSAWGKGYATEVARPMIEYVFRVSSLDTIYATIAPTNTKSQNVAGKLGLRFEREWDDDGDVALVYAITRDEVEKKA